MIKLGMKKYFLAGLVTLLPLWITIVFLKTLFYIVSNISGPILKPILYRLVSQEYAPFFFDAISFAVTFILVFFIGLLVTNFVGRKVFDWVEMLFEKMPFISGIYKSIRKLTNLFLSGGESKFKSVVLIEYPRKGIYSIAFVTSKSSRAIKSITNDKMLNIFVPTTPNPTSGYLIMVPESDVKYLDISVDDALKIIFSAGLMPPEGELGNTEMPI